MTNETILRPLYLARILHERTDEEHWLSTVQLCQILKEEYGFDTHRQTLNKDIQMLQKTGMDIDCIKSTQNRYRVLPRSFKLDKFLRTTFRMYSGGGEQLEVSLLCENEMMDAIIDRFGEKVKTEAADEAHFRLTVPVFVNSVFFSWIFGFGGKVKIEGPEEVKAGYREMVGKAMKGLK